MSIGFRVYLKRHLPPAELIEGYRSLPAANVADCMGRLSAISSEIKLLSSPPDEIVAGAALTVKTRPGDNLMIHKALNMAGPGDIIVVSNEGDRSQSLVGEIIVTYAQHKGISGLVFDGPIRDIGAISKMSIPVYGTGSTPGGPFKEGPGEINVPIACGGIQVEPGDIILGDRDGVIVIPRIDAARLLEEARRFSAGDHGKVMAAANGTLDRSWVDKTLEAKKCEIIDAVYGAA
jgi:regulator of RNase E activity RraA